MYFSHSLGCFHFFDDFLMESSLSMFSFVACAVSVISK